MSKTTLFVVKRGKVLKDTIHSDARLNLVRGNETEELALYHIYTNPSSRQYFETLPEDDSLKRMLAEYGEKFEAERNAKYGDGSGNTEADKIINDAKDKAAVIESEAQGFIDEANARAAEIIEASSTEADKIINDAKMFAETWVNEKIEKANTDAKKIIAEAKAAAKKIVAKGETDPIQE